MNALLDLLFKGGPLVWLLLCCLGLALAIFLERVSYYHRASMNVGVDAVRVLFDLEDGGRGCVLGTRW